MAARLSALRNHIVTIIPRAAFRTMSSSPSQNHSIAILDDYGDIASKHFTSINGLKVDCFPETLDPASEDGLRALADRLKSYTIIPT